MVSFDNRTKRLNVRVEPWRKQEIETYIAVHSDEYRDLSDFVLKACQKEMNPDHNKARFIRLLKIALTEDQEIRQLLAEYLNP